MSGSVYVSRLQAYTEHKAGNLSEYNVLCENYIIYYVFRILKNISVPRNEKKITPMNSLALENDIILQWLLRCTFYYMHDMQLLWDNTKDKCMYVSSRYKN